MRACPMTVPVHGLGRVALNQSHQRSPTAGSTSQPSLQRCEDFSSKGANSHRAISAHRLLAVGSAGESDNRQPTIGDVVEIAESPAPVTVRGELR